jgi:hypothetical protein
MDGISMRAVIVDPESEGRLSVAEQHFSQQET